MEARPNDFAGPIVHHVTAAGRTVGDSPLPATAQEPVALRVSQPDGCAFCVDRHTKETAAAGGTPVRPNPVAAWREATVFGGAERAAPELAEQGARIADTATGGTDEVGERATRHHDEEQLTAPMALAAFGNTVNRPDALTRPPAGHDEPGQSH